MVCIDVIHHSVIRVELSACSLFLDTLLLVFEHLILISFIFLSLRCLKKQIMRIYRLPGIRIESRYDWNFASTLIAIAVIVGLFMVSRWFATEAPRRAPMKSFYRQWVSQPMSCRYQQSPIRSQQSPIQMRHQNSPINSEAFELSEGRVNEAQYVIGSKLYPRQKRRRLTRKQREHLLLSQKGRCGICGKAMANHEICVDHKIPLASQDMHPGVDLNADWNLWCICVLCHSVKCADERQRGLYQRG